MIRLKNGFEVKFDKDFDLFFKKLLESIIAESKRSASEAEKDNPANISGNELFLKELMDNCIYVTHQLFELSEVNQELSKFMVTGFLFNSIILNLPFIENDMDDSGKTTLH